MRKIILFCLIIVISILDIFFLYKAFETAIEYVCTNSTQENMTSIFFTPIVILFVITIVTIINLICGITGFLYLREIKIYLNYFFYKKNDHVAIKVIKIIGYIFNFIYAIIFINTVIYPDYYGGIFSLLAIGITFLYIIWFTGVIKGFQIKQKNRTFIDIE
ncbi:hypothetical protein [Anaerosacchariphilus polymeriproducens]|uniref:DUF2975 domain-containing protein n=1 Tax=Anaerosacchariphilus polymeriproducens TaxID=1812858 RepID=A0A371B013_9FIRM|nr:hypothetical protein [Anaerosacchariphilus polymeriproducens]RDU25133.1 hypothetical protein DWV06_01140 [Anaerosacchariphilus polymeriproducens]